jgi:hypothetical protein
MTKAPRKKDSTQSGGINVDADKVNVGKDVIGRDQVTKAGEDVVAHDKITNVYYYKSPPDAEEKKLGQPKWLIPAIIAAVAVVVVAVVVVASLSNRKVDLTHLKPRIDVTGFAAPDTASTQLFTAQAGKEIPLPVQGRYDVGSVRWLVFRSPNSGQLAFVDSAAFDRPRSDFDSLTSVEPVAVPAGSSIQAVAIQDAVLYVTSDITKTLPAGTTVTVLGGTTDSTNNKFLCVQSETDLGWVDLNNFNLSANFNNLSTMSSCQ